MSRATYPCTHPRTPENSMAGTCGAYCRTCDNARSRAFRERNPGCGVVYLRAWRKRNPLNVPRRLPRLERAWRRVSL